MKRRSRFKLLIWIISITFVLPCFSQEKNLAGEDRFKSVKSRIERVIKNGRLISMAVAVAKNGEIIMEKGFGWADKEKKIKADEHTMYSLASISKPVTATGLMILMERGLVNIDDPVNKYIAPVKLTAYEGETNDAAIRHLLMHTSGLPTHYAFFYEDETVQPPLREESIRKYGILVNPPGDVYEYANFGYGILDHIISKVSGKSYADFMRDEVFLPLGLTHTSINIAPVLEEFAATRYDGSGNSIPFYTFDHPGASAVFSSAHDLVRFGMYHLKDKLSGQKSIISEKTLDLMHYDGDKNIDRYNFGWGYRPDDFGFKTLGHGGGMPGVRTLLKIFPDEDISIVVLANSSTELVSLIMNEIAGIVLPEYSGNRRNNPRKQSSSENEPLSDLSGEWNGSIKTSEGDIPVKMTIERDENINIEIEGKTGAWLRNVSFNSGRLTGNLNKTIKTEDTKMYNHSLFLNMRLKGEKLSGFVLARAHFPRLHWGYPFYIGFTKKE